MKRFALALFATLMLGTFLGIRTYAHHAAAATYVYGESVMIEGTLKEFVWRNPHSFMKVEAPDDKGVMQLWTIEGAAPTQLAEGGMTRNSLRPGDRIIVTGMPGRVAADHRILLEKVERPSDGFKWEDKSL